MSTQQDSAAPSADLVPSSAHQALPEWRTAGVPSDDVLRRTYRLAESLALSGAWKDIENANAAMAKIIVGSDLGLSAAQSMQGIHLVEGGIQMHYSTLGQFIRSRPNYDYRAGWLKVDEAPDATVMFDGGEVKQGKLVGSQPGRDARQMLVRFEDSGQILKCPEPSVVEIEHHLSVVWLDEEDPLDMRPVYGAVTIVEVDGVRRGVSRYTEDDARQAGLIKDDKPKAAWTTSRRNMLLARSLSNLVKWSIPEVMNGMPVYVPGELDNLDRRGGKSLTAPVGDGDDQGQGVDLGPKVEAIIARAEELGHRGLSNRAQVEMAVARRAPGVVKDWEQRASAELDEFEQRKREAAEAPETDIAAGDPEENKVEAAPETISGPVEQPPGEEGAETPPEVVPDADVVEEPPSAADDPDARLAAHLDAEASRPTEEQA